MASLCHAHQCPEVGMRGSTRSLRTVVCLFLALQRDEGTARWRGQDRGQLQRSRVRGRMAQLRCTVTSPRSWATPKVTRRTSACYYRRPRWLAEESLKDATIGFVGDTEADLELLGVSQPRWSIEITKMTEARRDVPVMKECRGDFDWTAASNTPKNEGDQGHNGEKEPVHMATWTK